MTTEHAAFPCSQCNQVVDHELRYAGRLLESSRCTSCGHVVELDHKVLVPAYIADLEQRVLSKPHRLWERAHRDRTAFLRGLPGAIVRQPAKFAREFWTLVKRS